MSLHHALLALELYRAADDLPGQVAALNDVGWCHAQLGEYETALDCCQQAIEIQRRIGEAPYSLAVILDSLGYVHHHLDQYPDAVACYEESIACFQECGDRHGEATTRTNLGDTLLAMGSVDAARESWRQAIAILDILEHSDAAEVRAKVNDLRR